MRRPFRRSCAKPCERSRPRKLQLLQPGRKIRDVNCSNGSYNFKERDRCNGDATNEVAVCNEKRARKNQIDAIPSANNLTYLKIAMLTTRYTYIYIFFFITMYETCVIYSHDPQHHFKLGL